MAVAPNTDLAFRPTDVSPSRLFIVAHHEAGHAVAAFKLGWPIKYLTTIPGHDERGVFDGMVSLARKRHQIEDQDLRISLARQQMTENLIFTMAGAAAQRKVAPRSKVPDNARWDEEDTRNLLALAATSFKSEIALRRFCAIEARELITRNWLAVEAVAAVAIKERWLNGQRVGEVIDQVDAAQADANRRYLAEHGLPDAAHVMAVCEQGRRRAKGVSRQQIANAALRAVLDHLAFGRPLNPAAIAEAVEIDAWWRHLDKALAADKLNGMVDRHRATFQRMTP
ncbi:hypothetical protein [Mesorhizobium sp. LNHC229A00]|uniref:hypothetical protein n=1 Tax=Mesorhizobium sp. LNHC229A00 TaxID=1287240 RepID=UPI0003CE8B29|nr:hypothetical protein [Mesorhizobium sp. LNHC229A00]ESY92316.1 hypothetical protein X741_21670 [Mesorhizobium sp. LNHC229A00]